MEDFYLGQVFEGMYPPEAAQWCNEGQVYHLTEIDPSNGFRRFQIVENEEWLPSVEEQILILQGRLAATDYVVIKIAEGAATREEYEDVIEQREQWRVEINALQEQV